MTVKNTLTYGHVGDVNYQLIHKAHSGLDLMWKKADDKTWAEDFTKNLLSFGLGFVPGIGPLLAIAFAVTWSAIRDDKETFWHDLSMWAPGVQCTPDEKAKVEKSFIASQQYVDPKWLTPNSDIRVGSIDKKPSSKVENNLDKAETVLKDSGKKIDGTTTMGEGNKVMQTVSPFG